MAEQSGMLPQQQKIHASQPQHPQQHQQQMEVVHHQQGTPHMTPLQSFQYEGITQYGYPSPGSGNPPPPTYATYGSLPQETNGGGGMFGMESLMHQGIERVNNIPVAQQVVQSAQRLVGRLPGAQGGGGEGGGAALPPGWEVKMSPDGRPIYIDHNTKMTHWHLPMMQGQQHQVADYIPQPAYVSPSRGSPPSTPQPYVPVAPFEPVEPAKPSVMEIELGPDQFGGDVIEVTYPSGEKARITLPPKVCPGDVVTIPVP